MSHLHTPLAEKICLCRSGGWRRLLVLALLSASCAAQAERADRSQPLQFDAGQVRIDGKRGVQLLTGGVEIRQGTMLIRAERVELRETATGRLVVAEGSAQAPLVQFRQKRDDVDEWIEGQAQRVEYDSAAQVVRLLQRAQVRVLRAGALADQVGGESIVYDNARDLFEVLGGGSGRVRGSITPRAEAGR